MGVAFMAFDSYYNIIQQPAGGFVHLVKSVNIICQKSLAQIVECGYNRIRILNKGGLVVNIKPSAAIRQNYNEIAELCRSTREPVYLTKNGEGDLVVMDIESFTRREKMLKLREELLSIEEERLHGARYYTLDELEQELEEVVNAVGEKCEAI